VEERTFFVFSVDMNWVEKNININGKTVYVNHKHTDDGDRTPKAYEYFKLLSLCDDKIISNSTFSWWAAWLNETPETRVICPYLWRPTYPETGMKFVSNIDLIPESWEVIYWDG
jgi:hypothetical protein